MLQLLDGEASVSVPDALLKLRHAARPKFTSACADVAPSFPAKTATDVTPTLTLSACNETSTDAREARSKPWEETLYRQEERIEYETVSVPVTTGTGKQCTTTTDFNTGKLENGRYGSTSTAKETCSSPRSTSAKARSTTRRRRSVGGRRSRRSSKSWWPAWSASGRCSAGARWRRRPRRSTSAYARRCCCRASRADVTDALVLVGHRAASDLLTPHGNRKRETSAQAPLTSRGDARGQRQRVIGP